jgi:hypothetical protein
VLSMSARASPEERIRADEMRRRVCAIHGPPPACRSVGLVVSTSTGAATTVTLSLVSLFTEFANFANW